MTIHDDPAARDALRVQLFQAIDGAPPDGAGEHGDPSRPGLLERCDAFLKELAGAAKANELPIHHELLDVIVAGGELLVDFRAFARQVRELLTRETEQLDKLPRSTAETVVDVSSTRAGVRLNVAGALLRGGLDQSGTCDAQAAIRFALDVLSAAFDHQAGRFDDEPAAVLARYENASLRVIAAPPARGRVTIMAVQIEGEGAAVASLLASIGELVTGVRKDRT